MKKIESARSGFAMIIAIIVIVVISTFMALSLSLTAQGGKRMTDVYLYEQMVLYAQSAVERTLLNIADNNTTDGCDANINQCNYTFNGIYDANVTIRYINTNAVAGRNMYINNIATPEQNGSVLMDVRMSVPTSQNLSTEPMTYFRRTIQKL